MSIIGIVLGTIAISLFIWIKKEQQMNFNLHDGDIEAAKHAYNALMDDFNHYQIETDRKIAQLEKNLEYQNNKLNKQSDSASKRMDNMNKSLPSIIGQVVGQIEFSQDTINRKM
jgi:ATP-dependent 26S proteasome regulatory subunit